MISATKKNKGVPERKYALRGSISKNKQTKNVI